MSLPYAKNQLNLDNYLSNTTPVWPEKVASDTDNLVKRVANEFFAQTFKQPFVRSIQFIRDSARLILKVPIRTLITEPFFKKQNWGSRERAKINAKLVGYSFIQMISVPVKILIAILAIFTLAIGWTSATKMLLDKSDSYSKYLDGRASQLEALKMEGCKKNEKYFKKLTRHNKEKSKLTFKIFCDYKNWLYQFNPILCR